MEKRFLDSPIDLLRYGTHPLQYEIVKHCFITEMADLCVPKILVLLQQLTRRWMPIKVFRDCRES